MRVSSDSKLIPAYLLRATPTVGIRPSVDVSPVITIYLINDLLGGFRGSVPGGDTGTTGALQGSLDWVNTTPSASPVAS